MIVVSISFVALMLCFSFPRSLFNALPVSIVAFWQWIECKLPLWRELKWRTHKKRLVSSFISVPIPILISIQTQICHSYSYSYSYFNSYFNSNSDSDCHSFVIWISCTFQTFIHISCSIWRQLSIHNQLHVYILTSVCDNVCAKASQQLVAVN